MKRKKAVCRLNIRLKSDDRHVAFFPYLQISNNMKSRKLYTKLLLAGSLVLMSGAMTSCDDFLTLLPTDQLPEENFWQDKADLEGVRAGAYQQLSQSGCTSKILTWGELRADNLTLNNMNQTDISYIQDGILQPNKNMFDWANFYTGINYCNLVLEEGYRMTEPDNEQDRNNTKNEVPTFQHESSCNHFW